MMKFLLILLITLVSSPLYLKSGEPFWLKLDNASKWDTRDITFDIFGSIYTAGGGGAYKSTDDGLTWRSLGLEGDHYFHIITDNYDYIFIASSRLLRSKDTGSTWEDITWRVGGGVYDRAMIMNKRNHLFVGNYRTTDHGDTWTNEYQYLGGYYSYAMNSEGHIFRGGSGHQETICRSTDDGDTWEVVFVDPNEWPKGVVCSEVHDMLFSPSDSVGYACYYKTLNNGRSWYINRDPNNEPSGNAITIDSLGHIYSFRSASGTPSSSIYNYLYKRVKDSTWVMVDTSGLNGVDEFNTMATSPNGYLYLAAYNGGLYRSRQAYVSAPDTPPELHSVISVSPNPASDYIDINLDRCATSLRCGTSGLRIYNSLGECVLSPLAFGEGTGVRLDISALPPGLYNCIFSTPKFMESLKFIIVR